MDFEEPARIARIRAEAEAFAAEHVTPAVVEEELRSGDGVNRPLMEAMGARGWVALTWPPEEGGAGLDPFEAAAVLGAIRAAGGPTIGAGTTMLAANAVRAAGVRGPQGPDPPRRGRRQDPHLPRLHRTRRGFRRLRLQDPRRP